MAVKRTSAWLAGLLCLTLGAAAVPRRARAFGPPKLPVPEIETLPNGLQLIWFVNDQLPVIDIALLVKSGYRDDPAGKSGTAELVSSLLDRGAAGMNAQEIARAVEMLGASRVVSADEEAFTIGMHGLAPDGPVLLDLLAKLALRPDFPEAEVKREHERILDRWGHIGDYGETLVSLAYRRVMASGTSYGRGGFYSSGEFAKVTRDDLVAYHKTQFTPKNSVLMVVGRVDKAEFRQKIQAAFGQWAGEAPSRNWKNFTEKRIPFRPGRFSGGGVPILLVDRPQLTQAQVRIGFRAPLVQAPEHYSLTVANALLGEYFNSRLNSLIRDKLALTYGISSGYAYNKDLAAFTVSSTTRNDATGQLIRKTLEVLKNLKAGPIPGDEVQVAKDYLEGGFPLSTSTLGAVASRWLSGYIFELGPGYLNEFVPKVDAVTRDQVLEAVNKTFDLDHLVIVVAGDAKEIEPHLRESKLGPVRKITVKDLM